METTLRSPVIKITWPGRSYLIKRAIIPFDGLTAFFGESYGTMYNALNSAGIRPNGMPSAIYFTVDEKAASTDLAAAIPIPDDGKALPGFDRLHVPAGDALKVEYTGAYDTMHGAYAALEEQAKQMGRQPAYMIEEYLNDPGAVADPSQLQTNIIWTLK